MNRVVAFVLATCVAIPSIACDGPSPGSVEERFASASFVAIVRINAAPDSTTDPALVEGKAQVVETLKGRAKESLPVRGFAPTVSCWVPIDVGVEYVVFLPDTAGGDVVWFSPFSKTISLSQIPSTILRKWRGKA